MRRAWRGTGWLIMVAGLAVIGPGPGRTAVAESQPAETVGTPWRAVRVSATGAGQEHLDAARADGWAIESRRVGRDGTAYVLRWIGSPAEP